LHIRGQPNGNHVLFQAFANANACIKTARHDVAQPLIDNNVEVSYGSAEADYATDVLAAKAVDFIRSSGDRPFFLFLHFYDPHWHYDPPEQERALFDSGYKGKLSGLWQDFKDKTVATTTPEEKQHLLDLYDGEIRYTDDEIGRILDHFKSSGLDKSTLVVFTSDHGEEFLEHGSWEHQKTLYEEVIRIPLALRGPGIAARREKAQASLLDIAPTVLAWAGLPPAPTHRGQSLLGPLPDREAYGETDHTLDGTHKLFVRSGAGRGKAILSLSSDAKSLAQQEWYDLATDPGETKDARPREEAAGSVRDKAVQRFRDDRTRGAAAPIVKLSPEQIERLHALGYIK
jgi:arylsulfatase A-like enzyme